MRVEQHPLLMQPGHAGCWGRKGALRDTTEMSMVSLKLLCSEGREVPNFEIE